MCACECHEVCTYKKETWKVDVGPDENVFLFLYFKFEGERVNYRDTNLSL